LPLVGGAACCSLECPHGAGFTPPVHRAHRRPRLLGGRSCSSDTKTPSTMPSFRCHSVSDEFSCVKPHEYGAAQEAQ
jgi:hypothetical protein